MSTTVPEKMHYTVLATFNGENVKKRTTDVDQALQALTPDQLHTEMFITVKTKGHIAERKLNLLQGRKLFSDPTYREIFISNLLLP